MTTDRQHRIVVGVSGSKASMAALRWAADEAKDRHARLDVVRARSGSVRWAPYAEAYGAATAPERRPATGELSAITAAAMDPRAASAAIVEVADDLPARALLSRCTGADLLVLGAHAPADPVSPPVGPVIRACLAHAPCPVVIVTP